MDVNQLVRENIRSLSSYSSARSEFSADEGIFFDANENPFGKYKRYPDPNQTVLKRKISDLKGVIEQDIFIGNGSDEVIDLLFRIFCTPGKDQIILFTPTYGMYQVSANINDINIIDITLNKNFQIDLKRVIPYLNDATIKLLFVCSPNNPTGNGIDKKAIEFLLKNFNGIVVLDEAYIDFSSEVSWASKVEAYPNLVVLQTLSKAWGLAGLRLGMAFSNSVIINFFNKVKPPYNISSANQKIALEALKYPAAFQRKVKQILNERERLREQLQGLKMLKKIYPSECNFLLIEVTDADQIYAQLIERNLIVRNRSKQVKNCLRITVGTKEENNILLNELKKIEE
ncbi:MAG: histidinol-phosphate transaminase [Flavobacteriales bacterium]|nr:histidinol-phosphate transaminase [Flavobacteriales bacterium]